jgi:hypothetical protein
MPLKTHDFLRVCPFTVNSIDQRIFVIFGILPV